MEENKCVFNSKLQNLDTEYCIIDIETTGISCINDEIIEIGIMKIKDGKQIERFISLVKPEREINQNKEKITNRTNEMLINAPSLKDMLPKIIEFIKDDVVVFLNSNFEGKFLQEGYKKCGYEFNNTYIDLLKIVKHIYPILKDYRIKTIADNLGIVYSENIGNGMLESLLFLKHIFNRTIDELIAEKYTNLDELNNIMENAVLFYANKSKLLNNYKKINKEHPYLIQNIMNTYKVNKRPSNFVIRKRTGEYFGHNIKQTEEEYINQQPYYIIKNGEMILGKVSSKTENGFKQLAEENTMFEKDLCKEIWFASHAGKVIYPFDVIDIQTPLKPKRKDKYGEIDITGVEIDRDGVVIIDLIEVKPKSTDETLLRAIVEVITYRYILEENIDKLKQDFKKYMLKYNGSGKQAEIIKEKILNNEEIKIKTKPVILVPEKLYDDEYGYSRNLYEKYKEDIDFYCVDYNKEQIEYHTKENRTKTLFKDGNFPQIYKFEKQED